MTESERNKLAKQHLPLVKKISLQMHNKCSAVDYDEIEGFGWFGLVNAMNKYDSSRSEMTFTQYAAYCILHAIRKGISQTGSEITVSYYYRKKAKEGDFEIPTVISRDSLFDGENEDHLIEMGVTDKEPSVDNAWNVLIDRIKENFPTDWSNMFFDEFGLDGHEVVKCKDIAINQGVSACLITKRTKKMIDFIKNDEELSELLRELL